MQTRILHTEIWQDDFFSELNPNEKLLFIYFLTNERVNIIHLYQCNNFRIKGDTGIDIPIIMKTKQKFQNAGKIYFIENYVFLKNASKYEAYRGPQNELAKAKLFARLSKSVIEQYNKVSDTPINTPIYTTDNTETINHNTTIRKENLHLEDINPSDVPL